ncbi:MAG: hypothetical protein BroJett003_26760 [Planctomycetota bacterium]|nr:MAG: hypothetical protein BroJett003_26760 [Planctomycetota bacterium]
MPAEMTDTTTGALLLTAATVGFLHTVMGPDHYVPFIAMSRSGRWSLRRTFWVTTGCGAAHVLSSVLLGAVGIVFRVALERLTGWEALRGDWAGWMLVGFGVAYMLWGLRVAARDRHAAHHHAAGEPDKPGLAEGGAPPAARRSAVMTGWTLFTIFVFGPCEPLIPLMMAVPSGDRWWAATGVAVVFGAATVGTMLVIVMAAARGLRFVRIPGLERFAHAGAGAAVAACGIAVKLGL